MGQTLRTLSERKIEGKPVFNNRFVNEICETVHFHYRNLRLILSLQDWVSLATGMSDSLNRWKKKGSPETGNDHIELCRKQILFPIGDDTIKVNLNKNLYPLHEGKIFSEGAGIEDKEYIHLKIRDVRLELSINEFNTLAECIAEAKENLCVSPS